MRNPKVIQRILALVMLLIFTFSITPKKYLHDLIADHTDHYSFHHNNGEASISKAGFTCDCEDLVVSTPFIEAGINGAGEQRIAYCSFFSTPYFFHLLPSAYTTKDSRGPPSFFFAS